MSDVLVVVACLAGGVAAAVASRAAQAVPAPTALFTADLAVGAAACLALPWRRRYPLAVGFVTAAFDLVSFAGSFAYLVAVFTVGARRSLRWVAAVAAAHLVAIVAGATVKGSSDPLWQVAISAAVILFATAAWGAYAGARRALIASLRDHAHRLEADRARDVERARAAERTRLAREMHDVLAHRMSLISLHAGALTLRTVEAEPTIADSADLVARTARTAMSELRDVIGLLRDPAADGEDGVGPAPPQPTLRDIGDLVAESRAAGLPVELCVSVADVDVETCPTSIGRHAYRVVQESLTNVHKHTDRAPTRVTLTGRPGRRLCVEVGNQLTPARPPGPGNGSGLVGLHERITRAGGSFDSGVHDGRFVVHAELDWP